jgi:hypothetical protein
MRQWKALTMMKMMSLSKIIIKLNETGKFKKEMKINLKSSIMIKINSKEKPNFLINRLKK